MGAIESSHGDIDVVCAEHFIAPGDVVSLTFRAHDDVKPPFTIKISSPSGTLIVQRLLQELPTGEPQSAPPVTFVPSAKGIYPIEIRQMRGNNVGMARLRVG